MCENDLLFIKDYRSIYVSLLTSIIMDTMNQMRFLYCRPNRLVKLLNMSSDSVSLNLHVSF